MSDTPTHCDECDPSFGCFATGTPCSKRPPDAQTPPDWMDEARQIAAQCWCDTETEAKPMDPVLCEAVARRIAAWMRDAAQYARNAEYWRNQVEDLRRQLAEAEADAREAREDASRAAMDAVKHAKELTAERLRLHAEATAEYYERIVSAFKDRDAAEGALAAERLRCKIAEERRDALSGELAAERAIPRACRALEQDEVGAPCSYLRDAEAALAAERAAREAAEESLRKMTVAANGWAERAKALEQKIATASAALHGETGETNE